MYLQNDSGYHKQIKQRNMVVKEMLSSEQSYINQLQQIISDFINPISRLKPDAAQDIFMNIQVRAISSCVRVF